MLTSLRPLYIAVIGLCCVFVASTATVEGDSKPSNVIVFPNGSGLSATYSTIPISTKGAFFQSLGTNGRSCGSCHDPLDAMTITPLHLQARFFASGGNDPVFRPVDGSTCPTADVSTFAAKQQAYSTLLNKGLIRISLAIPAGADFTLLSVDDPYNCTSASDIAMFRRPLPSTNLQFLSAVMWDGRESAIAGRNITGDLFSQATDATTGHAQAATLPTQAQLSDIVAFEQTLSSAQQFDFAVGDLTAHGAKGGAQNLSAQSFYIGINDVLGADPTGVAFNPVAMTMYTAWSGFAANDPRAAVARGETLFNTLPIAISGVAGLNDKLGIPVLNGTCTTCHDTPNVGDHSVKLPINIGIADASRRTPDLPLYTFQCTATGQLVQTTDPGRAMISGKCADIGKFKGPILRNLAARAPYFHNGSAADLGAAVDFYNTRFNLNLTPQQRSDLVAFLKTL